MKKEYAVKNGVLAQHLRQYPENGRRPGARPVLESGEAYKTVYLSKAPPSYKHDDLERAMQKHIKDMRRELQFNGKNVVKITKLLWGEGDMRVIAKWVVYGVKNTKKARRVKNTKAARRAKLHQNAGHGRSETQEQPGPADVQENPQPL